MKIRSQSVLPSSGVRRWLTPLAACAILLSAVPGQARTINALGGRAEKGADENCFDGGYNPMQLINHCGLASQVNFYDFALPMDNAGTNKAVAVGGYATQTGIITCRAISYDGFGNLHTQSAVMYLDGTKSGAGWLVGSASIPTVSPGDTAIMRCGLSGGNTSFITYVNYAP